MDAIGMKEILLTEYGIKNDSEFEKAVENMPVIMIGLFTTPLPERRTVECREKQSRALI